ncbi:MAG TPA: protoporphyrinogen oxidase [Opitutaceae bacterium]|nr:protoporphyrinogen oxidase [Opitutaceae bacterium]
MPVSRSELPIAVIGGGITGLAAAYTIVKSGRTVQLFDSSDRLGGVIRSERDNGWLSEAGPNSFQENSKEVVALVKELGLEHERVAANPAAKNRYIVREGKLCALPSSPGSFFATPLFSLRSKARILLEPFMRPRRRPSDVGLADFVADHFGTEIVDYALNPFVSGIYAGDATKLSTRHAFPKLWQSEQTKGSLIRGMMAQAKQNRAEGHPRSSIISFRGGLQTLTDALAGKIPAGSVELGSRIESLISGNAWQVVWSRGGETRTETVGGVVLALPAAAVARLTFGALAEAPLSTLDTVQYAPVASLFVGFRREQVAHPLNGFGVLIPSREKRQILGAIFSSSLFPDRAPPGHVALTVLSGGMLNRSAANGSDEEIVARSLAEIRELLGTSAQPVFQKLTRWPRAIPQYELGYERVLDAIRDTERAHPGLVVAGQVRDGISLPNCLMAGVRAGEKILQFPSEKSDGSK